MILNFIEFNYFHFLGQMEGFSGISSFTHPSLILIVGMEELKVGRGRLLSFPQFRLGWMLSWPSGVCGVW